MNINTAMQGLHAYSGAPKLATPMRSGESKPDSEHDGDRDDLRVSQNQASGPTLNTKGQLVGQKINTMA